MFGQWMGAYVQSRRWVHMYKVEESITHPEV